MIHKHQKEAFSLKHKQSCLLSKSANF